MVKPRASAVHPEDAATDEAIDVLVEDLAREEVAAAGDRRERVPAEIDDQHHGDETPRPERPQAVEAALAQARNATITRAGSTAPAGPLVSTAAAAPR